MRTLSIVVAVTVVASSSAYPCGDKLTSMNRGVRLQRVAGAKAPASIVIYSGAIDAGEVNALRSGLARGGHRIALAASREELGHVVAGHQDLIIAVPSDLEMVEASLSSLTDKPTVIRLLDNPSRDTWRQERKRCPLVMKMPGDALEHLAAVDGAMRLRTQSPRLESCTR